MQSTVDILVQMRSTAKAVLDADATAIRALMDAGTQADKALVGLSDAQVRVNKVVDQFLGLGVTQRADDYAAAVQRIGGPLILTEREQANVNRVMQDALTKYKALGLEAPPNIKRIADETQKLGTTTQTAEGFGSAFHAKYTSIIAGFVSGTAIIAAAGKAWSLLTDFIGGSVTAAMEAESAQKTLTTALQIQGAAVPGAITQYNELSAAFQNTTKYSASLITEMQGLLVQVGNVLPSQMKGALTAATNLASGLGIDLQQATMLVAKAFEGNTDALKRYGIEIDDAALKTEGADAIITAINAKVGGQAQAEMDTYAGKVALVGNTWEDVKQKVGEWILTSEIAEAAMRTMHDASLAAAAAQDTNTTSNTTLVDALQQGVPVVGVWIAALVDYAQRSNEAAAEVLALADAQRVATLTEQMFQAGYKSTGRDIELKSYTTELKLAQIEVTNLTAAEKAKIAEMVKTHATAQDINADMGVSIRAVTLYTAQLRDEAKEHKATEAAAVKHGKEAAKAAKEATKAYLDWRDEMRDDTAEVGRLNIAIDQSVAMFLKLGRLPTVFPDTGPVVKGIADIVAGMKSISVSTEQAGISVGITEGAFQRLGLKGPLELQKIAAQAKLDFDLIKAQGTAAPEAVQLAFERLRTANLDAGLDPLGAAYEAFGIKTRGELQSIADAARKHFDALKLSGHVPPPELVKAYEDMATKVTAALGRIPEVWETTALPRVTTATQDMSAAFVTHVGEVIKGNESLKLGVVGIWQTGIVPSVLVEIGKIVTGHEGVLSRMLAGMATFKDGVNGIWDNISGYAVVKADLALAAIERSTVTIFGQMLTHATGFKDGFTSIWRSIVDNIKKLLSDLLNTFLNSFLKGLLNAIMGQQGAFSNAFAGLFAGAVPGAGGVGGTGGTGGLAQSALGAMFGAGGVGVGTSIGAGVGAGAGAAGLGMTAGPTGIGAGIGGGGFMAGAGGAALGAGAIGGAGLGLGYLGTKLFGGSGWKASGFGAASGAGTGALIGTMVFPGIGTALGAAIGGLAGAIGGWIGKSQGEKVNDARDQFFATIGKELGATGGATGAGLDTGSSVIAAKLTQATGQAGGGAAFQNLITAKDQKALGVAAQAVLDILVKQKDAEDAIAAAAAKAGEEATLAGQAAAAAAAVEQAAVDQAKAAWEAKAATIKTTLGELATQQQQLADSIKAEAPEKVMGVIESRTRAEIDALAAKSAQLEKDLAAGTAATTTGLTTTIEATTAGMIVAGDTIGTAVIPKLEDMINRGINPAKDALGGVFDLFGQASQAAIDFGNTAYDAFMHAKDGADALALGQSPDGIQQIRVELEGAGRAAKPFEQSLVRAFEAAKDGVDGIFSGRPSRDERPARETVVAGSPIAINVTVGADAAGSKTTLSTNVREAFNDLVRRIDRNEDGLRTKLLRAMRLEPA